jgi:hypothetical protein
VRAAVCNGGGCGRLSPWAPREDQGGSGGFLTLPPAPPTQPGAPNVTLDASGGGASGPSRLAALWRPPQDSGGAPIDGLAVCLSRAGLAPPAPTSPCDAVILRGAAAMDARAAALAAAGNLSAPAVRAAAAAALGGASPLAASAALDLGFGLGFASEEGTLAAALTDAIAAETGVTGGGAVPVSGAAGAAALAVALAARLAPPAAVAPWGDASAALPAGGSLALDANAFNPLVDAWNLTLPSLLLDAGWVARLRVRNAAGASPLSAWGAASAPRPASPAAPLPPPEGVRPLPLIDTPLESGGTATRPALRWALRCEAGRRASARDAPSALDEGGSTLSVEWRAPSSAAAAGRAVA